VNQLNTLIIYCKDRPTKYKSLCAWTKPPTKSTISLKNYADSETILYINKGKGDTLAQRAASPLHQEKRRTSEDPEGDKPPPAPDQDLESNWIFQDRIYLLSVCEHKAQSEHEILERSYGLIVHQGRYSC